MSDAGTKDSFVLRTFSDATRIARHTAPDARMRVSDFGGVYGMEDTIEENSGANTTNQHDAADLEARIFWPWAEWGRGAHDGSRRRPCSWLAICCR